MRFCVVLLSAFLAPAPGALGAGQGGRPATPVTQGPQRPMRSPAAKTQPGPLAPAKRLFLIKPSGKVNIGDYAAPGYYTAVFFSAPWCAPCAQLRARAPRWLKEYPNLVIVDLDIGSERSEDGLDPEGSAILRDLGRQIRLPAALLINPFGLYINAGRAQGIAPPVSDLDAVDRAMAGLERRAHLEPLAFGTDALKRLRRLRDREAQPKSPRLPAPGVAEPKRPPPHPAR